MKTHPLPETAVNPDWSKILHPLPHNEISKCRLNPTSPQHYAQSGPTKGHAIFSLEIPFLMWKDLSFLNFKAIK